MGIFHVFIYLYVIFKATTKKKDQHSIILLIFLLFSQFKMWGVDSTQPPPPPHFMNLDS